MWCPVNQAKAGGIFAPPKQAPAISPLNPRHGWAIPVIVMNPSIITSIFKDPIPGWIELSKEQCTFDRPEISQD
jgi:hypothetical protein